MLKYLRQSSGMDFIDGLMHKRVYKFEEYRDTEHISMIFGKKGTNLCRIVKIGIPVPPGFIISSEAYFDYLKDGAKIYDKLEETYSEIILDWESKTGRRFNPFSQDLEEMDKFPILLSVRPSCGVADLASVPSSVLNIGLNDEIVQYIIQITGNKFFAFDLYRRFLQQFGTIVLGIRLSSYTNIEQHILHEENVSDVFSLSEDGMERLVGRFKEITDAPADGTQQLIMTIDAMYEWWIRNHPEEKSLTFGMSGISIIVQEMVHGNINHSSGSGIAYCTPFTRGIFGPEVDGQELKSEEEKKGSDVEALDHLKNSNPDVYEQVVEYAQAIKREFSENDEDSKISIDFTIQNGIVFVLEVKDQNKIAQLLSFVAAVDSSQKQKTSKDFTFTNNFFFKTK